MKRILSPIVWGNCLGIVVCTVLLIMGVKWGLDRYTHHGEEIEVPNVTHKMPYDAIAQLENEGLTGVVADSSFNRSLPAGVVLEQRPLAGAHVKTGREVMLTINSHNAPTMKLPDILGNSSTREAQDRLRQLGFKIGETQYVAGDKDWVYGMLANGRTVYNGEKVAIGSTITLQVGRGYTETDTLETEEEVYDYE